MRRPIILLVAVTLFVFAASAQGTYWETMRVNEDHWLFGADFISSNTGWAVGDSGTVVKTTNAGVTWTVLKDGSAETFEAVDFIDSLNGWAVGDNLGMIVKTTDGGVSWVQQDTGRPVTAIQMLSSTTGWAVGPNGLILSTTDGGSTWNPYTGLGLTALMTSVFFIDQSTGWIGGDYPATLFKTTDGGATWNDQTATIDLNETVESIHFIDQQTGWFVGYNYPDTVGIGVIEKTTDGGATWVNQTSGTSDFLLSIDFLNQTTGWAVGGNGVIVRTTDAGTTWTRDSSYTTDELDNVVVRPGAGAWIVGGRILRTNFGSLPELSSVNMLWHWNLVSLPLNVSDRSRGAVFPTSTSGSMYEYVPGSGYLLTDTLAYGRGYWLKFPSAQTVEVQGNVLDSLSIPCPKGWSIMGGIMSDVPVSNIIQNPPGSIYAVYGYNAGYYVPTSVVHGTGYWVKCTTPCTLTLRTNVGGISPKYLTDVSQLKTDELPPPAPAGEGLRPLESAALPATYALHQNFPNPFNPTTLIRYDLPEASDVRLTVYTILGQEVSTLVDGVENPGFHTAQWNGTSDAGESLSSGLYIYRLQAVSVKSGARFLQVNKMLFVK